MESEWTQLGLHLDSGGIPLGLLGLLGLHSDSTGIHLDSEQSNRSPMGRVGECKVQPPSLIVPLTIHNPSHEQLFIRLGMGGLLFLHGCSSLAVVLSLFH